MLIGGLWHGAAWKFVFWGGMHGVGLIVNKLCRPFTSRYDGRKWFEISSTALTLLFVSFLWVFFRAESFEAAWTILGSIFTNFSPQCIVPFIKFRTLWIFLMAFIITMHFQPQKLHDDMANVFINAPWILRLITFLIVIQLVVEFSSADITPFIYFQF